VAVSLSARQTHLECAGQDLLSIYLFSHDLKDFVAMPSAEFFFPSSALLLYSIPANSNSSAPHLTIKHVIYNSLTVGPHRIELQRLRFFAPSVPPPSKKSCKFPVSKPCFLVPSPLFLLSPLGGNSFNLKSCHLRKYARKGSLLYFLHSLPAIYSGRYSQRFFLLPDSWFLI